MVIFVCLPPTSQRGQPNVSRKWTARGGKTLVGWCLFAMARLGGAGRGWMFSAALRLRLADRPWLVAQSIHFCLPFAWANVWRLVDRGGQQQQLCQPGPLGQSRKRPSFYDPLSPNLPGHSKKSVLLLCPQQVPMWWSAPNNASAHGLGWPCPLHPHQTPNPRPRSQSAMGACGSHPN